MTIDLGFDTETKGLRWFDPDEQAFLFSWADDTGSYVGRADRKTHVAKFLKAVKRADRLVAHNLSFDVHQLRATLGIDMLDMGKPCIDTDHLARIVLPERATAADEDGDRGNHGYKLKDLAKTYLRADAQAAEQAIMDLAESIGVKLKGDNATPAGYYLVWRAYPKEMEHYAILDAEYARDLLPILERKLPERQRQVWELEQAVAPILIRAEARGVQLDQDVVAKLRAEYEPLEESARATFHDWLGEDVDPGSRNELRDALIANGVPLWRKTKSGNDLSTASFALQEFSDRFPGLKALEDWRAASKMLSTYIEPLSHRDTVHPSFWQIGAWTGRMSCSRPNMQNMPARDEPGSTKLREVFVPRDGYVFVVNDYEQIELKMLAMYLNDPGFTELIESGYDAFAWLAAEVDGGNPEDFFKGTLGAKRRGDLKNVTYAICYGAGKGRITDMLNLDPGPPAAANDWAVQRGYIQEGDPTHKAAQEVINKVKQALPRYMELASTRRPKGRVPKRIEAQGFVTTIMGRKQVVPKDKGYVGLNALIQGGAADAFKAGLVEVDKRFRAAGLDAHPVLFIHDELVSEVREDQAEEALRLQTEGMEAAHVMRPALKAEGTIARGSYAEGK